MELELDPEAEEVCVADIARDQTACETDGQWARSANDL